MKTIATIAALLVFTLPLAASASDEDDVRAVLQQVDHTLNSGDAEGFVSLFTEDGIELPPDGIAVVGIDKIMERETAFAKANTDVLSMNIESLRVSGDIAVVRISQKEDWTPKAGGKTHRTTGQSLVVLERQGDGSWKFTEYMWTSVEVE